MRDEQTGIAIRYIRQWDIKADPAPVHIVFEPNWYALAGHAGHCERVTRATVLGTLDGPCTCGAQA